MNKILAGKYYHTKEPHEQGASFKGSKLEMIRAYNYYHAVYDRNDAYEWIVDDLKTNPSFSKDEAKAFGKVPLSYVTMTPGVIAKLRLGGVFVPAMDLQWYENHLRMLINRFSNVIVRDTPSEPVDTMNVHLADTEILIDDFYRKEYKIPDEFNYYTWLGERGVKQYQAKQILDYYKEWLAHVQDKANNEYYKRLTISQKRHYEKFLQTIVDDCQRFVSNESKKRSVTRKPKKINKGKAVSKLSFCSEVPSLKLASINPSEIVGADTLWVYNHKTRKLIVYKAKEKGFEVRGTSLYNVDEAQSWSKTIRKPEIIAEMFLNKKKNEIRDSFSKIKSTPVQPKNRISSDVILLKAFR